jgi:hypothetical protein
MARRAQGKPPRLYVLRLASAAGGGPLIRQTYEPN